MDPVERLVAIEEIRVLKARYVDALDTKQWDALGHVFTDDVVMEVPPLGSDDPGAGMRIAGRDTLLAFLAGRLTGATSVHRVSMPMIEILDADHARGTWAMEDYITRAPGATLPEIRGYGHYHEEYRRVGAAWCISMLQLTRQRVDILVR